MSKFIHANKINICPFDTTSTIVIESKASLLDINLPTKFEGSCTFVGDVFLPHTTHEGISIGELCDVQLSTTVAADSLLSYNTTASQWQNTYTIAESPTAGTIPIRDVSANIKANGMYLDTIMEQTEGHGVIIDGLTIKDNGISVSTITATSISASSITATLISATSITTPSISVDTISEKTGGSGVSIDGLTIKDSGIEANVIVATSIVVDMINENMTGAGVQIDGVAILDSGVSASTVNTDSISELSDGNGISIDGIKVKDSRVSADTVNTDTISELTDSNGVSIDGIKIKDSGISAATVYTDVISEKTSENGIQVDSIQIKDTTLTSIGNGNLYINGLCVNRDDQNLTMVGPDKSLILNSPENVYVNINKDGDVDVRKLSVGNNSIELFGVNEDHVQENIPFVLKNCNAYALSGDCAQIYSADDSGSNASIQMKTENDKVYSFGGSKCDIPVSEYVAGIVQCNSLNAPIISGTGGTITIDGTTVNIGGASTSGSLVLGREVIPADGESPEIPAPTMIFKFSSLKFLYEGTHTGVGSNLLIDGDGYVYKDTSSLKYKENINNITQSDLSNFSKLRMVSYNLKKDASKTKLYGVIAEEIANLFPTAVVRTKNNEIEAVNYNLLFSVGLAKILDLEKRISSNSAQGSATRMSDKDAKSACNINEIINYIDSSNNICSGWKDANGKFYVSRMATSVVY